jgi:hypothetical protein
MAGGCIEVVDATESLKSQAVLRVFYSGGKVAEA